METRTESLTQTTGRALSWNYLGSFLRLFLAFGVNVLLTRLLGPKPFGEFAIAMLLFGFGFLLANVGITSALIQRAEISSLDIRFCFTCQMIVTILVASLLAMSAPAWSIFFHQPELTTLLRAIVPLFIFQSFGTTSSALLNRAQRNREIQSASIISYLTGFIGFAVPMAFLGCGVWCLVAAYLAQALVNAVLLYRQTRHSLKPLLHREGTALLRFGFNVFGCNLCNWGIGNLDNTVVGRVAGPIALGLYSRAFLLAQLPADTLVVNLQQVMLPAFSRVQGDSKRLARVFLSVFGLLALVLLPPFCAMATVPGVVILGLYGPKWAGAIPLFQPLALALPLYGLMGLSGPTLAARGKPRTELMIQFPIVLIALVAFTISIHFSLPCLSWCVLCVYVLRFAGMTHAALRELGIGWQSVIRVAWPALLLAAIAAATAFGIDSILPMASRTARLAIVAAGVATAILIAAVKGYRFLLTPILRDTPQIRDLLSSQFKLLLRWGRA